MKRSLILSGSTSLVLLVLVGYFLTEFQKIDPRFLPSFHQTIITLYTEALKLKFWQAVSASTYRVSVGFLCSFIVAYPLVILAMINTFLKEVIFNQVEFFRYLPVPAFIPLVILWFGVNDFGKVIVIFLGTFIQMIPMFYDSSMILKRKYDAFTHALKWKPWKYIIKIIIPGTAPYIWDNARLCFGWAWTYLIMAELLGGENSIGHAIVLSQRYLKTDVTFSYILTIGIIGICTDRLMFFLKKILFRWHT